MYIEKSIDNKLLQRVSKAIGGCNFQHGPWIAGGCARRLYFDKQWIGSDIDIFFKDAESFNLANENLLQLFNKQCKIPVFLPSASGVAKHVSYNSDTYKLYFYPGYKWSSKPILLTIQCIKKLWATDIQDLLQKFDFSVCQFVSDSYTVKTNRQALEDCETNTLRFTGQTLDPRRVLKYCIYGYDPESKIIDELLKFRFQNSLVMESDDEYDFA